MRDIIAKILSKATKLKKEDIERLIENPPSQELGDFSFPCFILSKTFKKNPNEIAIDLSKKIVISEEIEKIQASGPYLNFYVNKTNLARQTIQSIQKEDEKYGSSKIGKGKKIVLEFSSPNIAKPFGIGHLRSTIIGKSLSNIHKFLGYKVININYFGDWGTPFGKLMAGYKEFGSEKELKKDPIRYLYDIYVKVSKDISFEEKGREYFKNLEDGDKSLLLLWKRFRELSIKDFNKIYLMLNIKFDLTSGESDYKKDKLEDVINMLKELRILEESENALIVNLEKYNLGVCLIQKSDGTPLYAVRDIAAAIDRYNKYKFDKMIYEVGAEQKLHLKQVFKILELLGFSFAKDCIHVYHGLYLGIDGKKLSTREGKTFFMEQIIQETMNLAKKEISKREKISSKELERRALAIAISAILYGDLKNYRSNDLVFIPERFVSFEGDTGPYLLYSYARAKSILKKAKFNGKNKYKINSLNDHEKNLIISLSKFQEVVTKSCHDFAPNIIANYAFHISKLFNEFYHSSKVIDSEQEQFRLFLVKSFLIVLRNSLSLLGINVLEKM